MENRKAWNDYDASVWWNTLYHEEQQTINYHSYLTMEKQPLPNPNNKVIDVWEREMNFLFKLNTDLLGFYELIIYICGNL